MANLRGEPAFTETVVTPISPTTVIQCTSEIMFQSTDWIASSATYNTEQHVCVDAHLLDTVDVKALLPVDHACGASVYAEPLTIKASSASESPALFSSASEIVDIDTSLSSSCSSQTPVTNLKSILKNRIEPPGPQRFKAMEVGLEDNIEYDADSDMDAADDEDDVSDDYDEPGANDSDWSNEYDDNEYSDEEGSFVCFVNSVSFSAKADVCIIPSRDDTGDDSAELEMTFHEQAHRMQASKRVPYAVNGKDYDPNEHSPDVIDLDKQLFMAYVNGIRNMNAEDYQPVVLSRTLNAAPRDIDVLPITEHQVNAYLDRVVDSLLGFFPYLFGKDEYSQLLDVAEVVTSFDDYNNVLYKQDSGLLQQAITHQLEEKLSDSLVLIENDILDWVAGELIEPLGRHASFR